MKDIYLLDKNEIVDIANNKYSLPKTVEILNEANNKAIENAEIINSVSKFIHGFIKYHRTKPKYRESCNVLNTLLSILKEPQYKKITIKERIKAREYLSDEKCM